MAFTYLNITSGGLDLGLVSSGLGLKNFGLVYITDLDHSATARS